MTSDLNVSPIPRIALKRDEAAASLGISLDSFEKHVQPNLRLLEVGAKLLVPVSELEKWTDTAAVHVIPKRRSER